ncbi:MAG: hypothetical protein ACXWP5_16040, partial [Bdellovibrionota bacterium]
PYQLADVSLAIDEGSGYAAVFKLTNAHWDNERLVLVGEDAGTNMKVQCDPAGGSDMICRHYTKETQVLKSLFHLVKTPPQFH